MGLKERKLLNVLPLLDEVQEWSVMPEMEELPMELPSEMEDGEQVVKRMMMTRKSLAVKLMMIFRLQWPGRVRLLESKEQLVVVAEEGGEGEAAEEEKQSLNLKVKMKKVRMKTRAKR